MYKLFAWSSALLLITLVAVVFSDYDHEWKDIQKTFYNMELEKAKDEREKEFIKSKEVEIQQILVDAPGRVDRCTTCHLGVDDSRFVEAEEPYRTHPNPSQHPFPKFGCTICHGGNGRSTIAEAAHGDTGSWEHPEEELSMLPMKYIQAFCGKCHVDPDLPGMEILALGNELYDQTGCLNCHKFKEVGKNIGPDLTNQGSHRRKGGHRPLTWLFEHFKDPASLVPDTEMPDFRFSDEEAEALTLLMIGFTDETIPENLASRRIAEENKIAIRDYELAQEAGDLDAGEQLYVDMRCNVCHAIQGEGGLIGPSLTIVGDRRKRIQILTHLQDPQGTVPYSIMPDFRLSDEEVEDLTEYLLTLKVAEAQVIALRTAQAVNIDDIEDPGEKIYVQRNCNLCHALNGRGAPVGPDLSNIGKRRDTEWLTKHLESPKAAFSKSIMPKVSFTDEDIQTLTEYLTTLEE